jgi:hypothetical protein
MTRNRAGACLLPILLLLAACGVPGPRAASALTATPTRWPVNLPTATLTPTPAPTLPTLRANGPFTFVLPEGYRLLEADGGGCFVYHETLPGFLVLYPAPDKAGEAPGKAGEALDRLLAAVPDVRDSEALLEVDVGGRTFTGLFVETHAGNRLFLAAAAGDPDWVLVVQGPAGQWPALAAGFNRVLTTLVFEEAGQ